MFKRLILKIILGIIGIWLASEFVPGVEITSSWETFAWIGLILGLMNFFLKPVLNIITMPLRIISLGLFSLVINMGIIWVIDIIFPEIVISGISALFWTTFIVWLLNLLPKFFHKKKLAEEKS